MEKKRANPYSCTAYLGSRKVNFMKYVHKTEAYQKWLERQNIEWSVINVYDRKNRTFIERIYKVVP